MFQNPTIDTDAYKVTHWLQRPLGINKFVSYGEPRLGGTYDKICFSGLQYILKEYFTQKVTEEHIKEGKTFCKSVFGFDHYYPEEIWRKVSKLGYFPLKIKAVREGSIVPTSNVLFTIESTEPWFADMISHFEDYLMWLWYSCETASRSYNIKKNILPHFKESCDKPFLNYAVNDFGLRGAMFKEAGCLGGLGHLIFFDGSDNLPAGKAVMDYYNSENVLGSVWATEHSIATVFGKSQEIEYVKQQLIRSHSTATISIVIDSYDADNFMKEIVGNQEIKDLIINRTGRTVFRPDSNDPLTNVCKYSEILGNHFGYDLNRRGYKVLKQNVGLIQGDGMNENSIPELYKNYIKTGWSADNVIVGSGGGLLTEGLTRDRNRWAIKCCYVEINNNPIDVSKTPKSDMTKISKAGKLKLHCVDGKYSTIQSSKETSVMFNSYINELVTVFENGKLLNEDNFSDIRKRANVGLNG